jgi:hypothetical protein
MGWDRLVQADLMSRLGRGMRAQVVGFCLACSQQVIVKTVGRKDEVCGLLYLAEWSCCVPNRSDEAGVKPRPEALFPLQYYCERH